MCSNYRIAFDGKGKWSFDNDYDRNVVILGVGNCSSSHADNRKNNFLLLREWYTLVFISLGAPEKEFSINFSKVNTKFCLSLH